VASYGYAKLGRFGLTHGILAWARCVIWCEQTGARMIAPVWFKVRVGPYLRKERDKRNYFLLFHSGSAISGFKRLLLLATVQKQKAGSQFPSAVTGPGNNVMVFENALGSNEVKYFNQIVGHGPLLRRKLIEITLHKYIPSKPKEPFIAIHVRLGDFIQTKQGDNVTANTRLPMDWYVNRLDALRLALGNDVPVILFSDGTDEDLTDLTDIVNVRRAPKQQSVTDLLAMGHGIALISSGSGFSLWGAFLGNAPRLCYPGQMIVPAYGNVAMEIESDFDSKLPKSFIGSVLERISEYG
jgi:hypothetical protein